MRYRNINIDENRLYGIAEVSELVGKNFWTIRHWSNLGHLTCKRLGKKQDRFYSSTDIIRLINIIDYREEGYILSVAAAKADKDVKELKYINISEDDVKE